MIRYSAQRRAKLALSSFRVQDLLDWLRSLRAEHGPNDIQSGLSPHQSHILTVHTSATYMHCIRPTLRACVPGMEENRSSCTSIFPTLVFVTELRRSQ